MTLFTNTFFPFFSFLDMSSALHSNSNPFVFLESTETSFQIILTVPSWTTASRSKKKEKERERLNTTGTMGKDMTENSSRRANNVTSAVKHSILGTDWRKDDGKGKGTG